MNPIPSLFLLSALVLLSTSCANAAPSQPPPPTSLATPSAYARLLSKYVTSKGVRYAAWHRHPADLEALDNVVDFYAHTLPPKDKTRSFAWHINAYNAWILHNVLKKFPTKGPLDGELFFFFGNRIMISGEKTSFNHLEKNLIRPLFKDPRVHFALNCASASCPPLLPKPYLKPTLSQQLDQQSSTFLNNNPHAIQIRKEGREIWLSRIFDWYKTDFESTGGVIAFINQYHKPAIPPDSKIHYMDYDWSLNSAGP